jgi:YHS domain-containing protein
MSDGDGVSLDPVCGRPVVEQDAESVDYKRKRYFFCSGRCKAKFERQAERIHVGELAKIGSLFGAGKVHWGLA